METSAYQTINAAIKIDHGDWLNERLFEIAACSTAEHCSFSLNLYARIRVIRAGR